MSAKRRKGRGPARERPLLLKVIDILHEDAKRRRALRLLERQKWGLDFLAMALARAGRYLGEGVSLVITDRNGARLELRHDEAVAGASESGLDESVFMHLDDDLFVERFIRENSRR